MQNRYTNNEVDFSGRSFVGKETNHSYQMQLVSNSASPSKPRTKTVDMNKSSPRKPLLNTFNENRILQQHINEPRSISLVALAKAPMYDSAESLIKKDIVHSLYDVKDHSIRPRLNNSFVELSRMVDRTHRPGFKQSVANSS